ncbi:hypothetical protein ACFYYD_26155 [Streptomyces bluensis]|uniref:hypothetical protein n=1 Tax=Streptomyces bluensis TaxID=33897 RepID=UPI00368D0782
MTRAPESRSQDHRTPSLRTQCRPHIRDEMENMLTAIDEDGGAARAWTYTLYDND